MMKKLKLKRETIIVFVKILKVVFGAVGISTVIVEGYPILSAVLLGVAAGSNELLMHLEKQDLELSGGSQRTLMIWLGVGISVLFLSGCGTFKKTINKSSEAESSTSVAEVITNRTVTEITDTNITIPCSSAEVSTNLDQLCPGEIFSTETEDVKIEIWVDPLNKKIGARGTRKEKKIPVNSKRQVIEQVTERSHTETKKAKFNKVKNVKADTSIPGFFWLLLVLIVALVLWFFRKNFLPFLFRGNSK